MERLVVAVEEAETAWMGAGGNGFCDGKSRVTWSGTDKTAVGRIEGNVLNCVMLKNLQKKKLGGPLERGIAGRRRTGRVSE